MLRTLIFASAATALLAACASPQQQERNRLARMAERTLDRMEAEAPRADPGLVAAADFAFARMAQDEGQWTAFRTYAANGAVLHGDDGVESAAEVIPLTDGPAEAMRWAPNAVWSSCNGRLAVSMGKFRTPDGTVGTYATVWQRQRDRELPYKFLYTMGAVDDPQPAPRVDLETPEGDDVIVVEELTMINALTADCQRAGESSQAIGPPWLEGPQSSTIKNYTSDDGTLHWSWEQSEDGTRYFAAQYLRGGAWERVVELHGPKQRMKP